MNKKLIKSLVFCFGCIIRILSAVATTEKSRKRFLQGFVPYLLLVSHIKENYLIITHRMDEIDCNILNAIKSLRESKQQPNEVSIFKLLSADDDEKPVDRGIFQQHLEKLVSLEKLINRPCNRRNSYYIVNPTETTGELNVIDQPITIEPEQDKFFEPKLDNNENYTQNNSENDIVENKIRVLTAEIEAVKLFMKEQIYLLKKVVEEKNFKAENEGNTMLIELLCRQIKSLTDENASKNEIIKILAENQKQHPSTSEKFIEVKGKNNNKTIEKTKYQLQLSKFIEVLMFFKGKNNNKTINEKTKYKLFSTE